MTPPVPEIFETLPLVLAYRAYGPKWARAAILAWHAADPGREVLIGWRKGDKPRDGILRWAARQYTGTLHMRLPSNCHRVKLESLERGEIALQDNRSPTTVVYAVRVGTMLAHSATARKVRVTENAARFRRPDRPGRVLPELPPREKRRKPPGPFTGVGSIEVRTNPAREGIEIRFQNKPPVEKLRSMFRGGWRFSRWARCWYRKDSEQARASAQAICESFGMPFKLEP